MTTDWETLIPVLVHIQANLDGDLSLGALGKKAGLSPFHFQRLFKAAIGETPKSYTLRLRLDRAAFRLILHDGNVIEQALDCGFRNHESFTRAFRRRFERTPSQYRDWLRQRAEAWSVQGPAALADPARRFEISATKVVRLREMDVAFVRHVGPYEAVPDTIFDELERWAANKNLPGPPVWLGIGHDAPGVTPSAQLRFDAALRVWAPFAPEGRVAYQRIPGGHFALTTHAGPYDTLPAAYASIFPRLAALRGYRPICLPAIEIYQTTKVDARHALNHTAIYLPVEPAGA